MVISAFRKGPFPEWLISKAKNKERCTLLKVLFSPWGSSFLWAGCVACAEPSFTPVCSWFPAEESKSLSGQAFTLQDPGPCYLTDHPSSLLQAPQLHLTSGTVMNIACSPAPLSWRASSSGLGDSPGAYCIRRTSYHYKSHYLLISLWLHEEVFPP